MGRTATSPNNEDLPEHSSCQHEWINSRVSPGKEEQAYTVLLGIHCHRPGILWA